MAKVVTISPQCITSIDPKIDYKVFILEGAARALVSERHLRNKYETNREIKYWAVYFQLKAVTTSGEIQSWRSQRQFLLTWLQMKEAIFYRYLRELKHKGLLTIDDRFNIKLVSFKQAAKILDIPFTGTTGIPYNPFKNEGKQVFQYFLRAEEMRERIEDQLNGLVYHLDKNPPLRNDLIWLMTHNGADGQRLLSDKQYLQERLLKLQQKLFRHGSEILEYAFTRRADINRSILLIKKDHCYKSYRSVGYLKRRMSELGVIKINKVRVDSKVRSRLYVPDSRKKSGRRDGYRWNDAKQQTTWFLTDQIQFTYQPIKHKTKDDQKKIAA